MWTALATDCANEQNGLPSSLRAQLISISLWVGRHTSAVIRRQEEIGPLIDINRIIMQGLSGQMAGSPAPTPDGAPAPMAQSA